MSMEELSLLLICVVVAWPEAGWRAEHVAPRVEELFQTPTTLRSTSPVPGQGSTIEPSLLAKMWVNQPRCVSSPHFSSVLCHHRQGNDAIALTHQCMRQEEKLALSS